MRKIFKAQKNNVYVVPEIPDLVIDGYEVFGIINLNNHNKHKKHNKCVSWNSNICIEYNYPD